MTCRLCGCDSLYRQYTVNGCALSRCNDCGFLQVAEKPTDEELAQIYAAPYFSHSKYQDMDTLNKEFQRRLQLMEDSLDGRDRKVLEFGCGTGDFITFINGRFDMWGIDISSAAIARAKETLPALQDRLQAGHIKDFSFPPEFFDAVVSWDTIEHIWDPVEVYGHLFRLIKPGGYMLLSTPNSGAFFARITGKYWPFMTPPEHLGFFSRRSITCFVREKLGGSLIWWNSKGKWVNLGFLFYKVKRILPALVPGWFLRLFLRRWTRKWAFYVPTGDIQYVVIRKELSMRG